MIDFLLWAFLGMPAALAILYTVGIQYERGGYWLACTPFVVVGLIVDVVANWTVLSVYLLRFPPARCWTFSQHLEGLVFDAGWRGSIARRISTILNFISPSKRHIKTWQNPPLPRQA